MPDVDLAELVALAHAGDADAFTRLIANLEPDWRLHAATFCGSQAQIEAALRCTVVALRSTMGECPPDTAALVGWVRSLLQRQIDRLLTLAQRPGSGDDAVTILGATQGLEALRRDATAALAASQALAERCAALAGAERQLLERRYVAHQVTAEDLPVLARLRARLAEAPDALPADPAACENALASSNAAVRNQALAGTGDEATRQALAIQLRTHLLLNALLAPLDAGRTQQLSTTVGFTPETAYPGSTRGSTQDTQLAAPVTFSVQEPSRRPSTRVNRAAVRPSPSRRPPESVAVPMDPPTSDGAIPTGDDDDDFDRSQRRTNYFMWGAIAAIAITATIAVTWLNKGPGEMPGPATPGTTTSNREAAIGIATVVAAEGQVQEILPDRQRHAARNGSVLQPGQGLLTGDGDSSVIVRLEGIGTMTVRNGTIIHSIVTDPQDPRATLVNLKKGSVSFDALTPRTMGRLSVNTDYGRMVSTGLAGEVKVAGESMSVSVRSGAAHLSGNEDTRQVGIGPGLTASTNADGRAILDAPRRFMRGINLGGGEATVRGQTWLAQDVALRNGLNIVAGQTQQGGTAATARLDTGLRAMLDCGLAGDANGIVTLTQKLPPALWELELWIVNDQGSAGQRVGLAIDGQRTPIGLAMLKGPTWRVVGPIGCITRGDQVDLRISGLGAGDRLAGLAFRLVGQAPDTLGPAFATVPPWSAAADLGGLLGQWWDQLKGNGLASLQNDPRYPNSAIRETITTSASIPMAEESWSGHRLVGFIHPPATGDYVFQITADGNAELLLGADDNHLAINRIAHVPRTVKPDEWDRYREQTSRPVRLVAGQRYAIEVVHRESNRTTHLGIGWRRPDGVEERPIPGSCLSPLRKPLNR